MTLTLRTAMSMVFRSSRSVLLVRVRVRVRGGGRGGVRAMMSRGIAGGCNTASDPSNTFEHHFPRMRSFFGNSNSTTGNDDDHRHPAHPFKFHRRYQYQTYSTLTSSPPLWWPIDQHHYRRTTTSRNNSRSENHHFFQHQLQSYQYQHQQRRTFLIPLVFVGVGAAGAWVLYRKSQGKPVASDNALAAQQAYQKQQEELYKKNNKNNMGINSSNSTAKTTSTTTTTAEEINKSKVKETAPPADKNGR